MTESMAWGCMLCRTGSSLMNGLFVCGYRPGSARMEVTSIENARALRIVGEFSLVRVSSQMDLPRSEVPGSL